MEAAHKFLDYMMRPEVAAADSNYTWYATANAPARDMVDSEVTGSPASYPPPEAVARMYTLAVLPRKVERLVTRVWTTQEPGSDILVAGPPPAASSDRGVPDAAPAEDRGGRGGCSVTDLQTASASNEHNPLDRNP